MKISRSVYLIILSMIVSATILVGGFYFVKRIIAASLDNADTAGNWASSDSNLLTVAQETTIKQEGTGSVKLTPITPTTSWYNFSWPYRLKLTIDATKVDADLTNFPVYVDLNDLPSGFHTNVNQTDARDIRVTKSDGLTELPREVVFYTAASDTGELHFQYSGTLSGTTNTDIYIYYGNAGASDYAATDTYGRNNVWTGYEGAYHMNENAANTCNASDDVCDSSGTGNELAFNGNATHTSSSKVGAYATTYDGTGDYLSDTPSWRNTLTAFTVEGWFYTDSLNGTANNQYSIMFNLNGTGLYPRLRIRGNGQLSWQLRTASSTQTADSATGVIQAASWQHIVMTFDTNELGKLYVDGVEKISRQFTSGTLEGGTTGTFNVGYDSNLTLYYDGQVDEYRVSATNYSQSWAITAFNNQASPGTFFSSFGTEETITTSWYNFSWPYRLKLTIDATKVDADLTNFPVYVDLNDLPAGFHTNVNQTDARDIRVTKSDGVTELPREVVFYTAASDTGELHFQYSGTLSGTTNTDIYIYYGNAGGSDYAATDTYGRNNVWDSVYNGVWHLQETSGNRTDSSGNNNTLSDNNTVLYAAGIMGNAADFEVDNNEYLSITDANQTGLDPTTNFTVSVWHDPENNGSGDVVGKGNYDDSDFYNFGFDIGIGYSGVFYRINYNWGQYYQSYVYPNNVDDMTNVAFTHNGSNDTETLYIDGSVANSATSITNDPADNTAPFVICNLVDSRCDGLVDEVRFSSTALTSTWISTQYNNQAVPGTFFSSFGTAETIVGQTATRTVSATDLSGYDSITYWVRSNRTGSFIRFQFGETASSEQTNAITISTADTWEQKTWDISAISAGARDAVTKYAFYVTDASANFNFYFDDIQASTSNSAPSTPSLDSPADTATNQSLTPALLTTTTDADSDYLRYKIELCENVGMSTNCQTFDQTASQTGWSGQNTQTSTAYTSGTQATYTIQSALTSATTYYWRSYAIDPGGTNTWSSTQGTPYSFTTTTAPSAPGTPYTEGSTNPTGITDLTPEFSAIHSDPNSDAAVYYEIEVNTASNFAGTVMWDTGQAAMSSLASGARSTDVSYAGTSLSYNGSTYYWRIRFWDNKGAVSNWSTTQSFSTNSAPATPSLDSPADTATNQSLAPSLLTTTTDTDSDYLRYKIELCENVGMSTNCQTFDQTSSQTGWSGQNTQTSTAYTSGTQATYTIQSSLSNSTTYYWRSYAIDPAGTNTWSGTQTPYSFTTLAGGGSSNMYLEGINLEGVSFN